MSKIDINDALWFKSSYSNGGDNCIENAELHTAERAVRDSKDISKGAFVVSPQAWQAFVDTAKSASI